MLDLEVIDGELVRALKVLARKGACVCCGAGPGSSYLEDDGDSYSGIVVKQGLEFVCEIRVTVWKQLFELGCLEKDGDHEHQWRISKNGRGCLKRVLSRCSEAVEIEGAYGVSGKRGSIETVAKVKTCEGPLAWLRRRKDKCGRSLIDEHQFDAGERLREDFYKGQMGARVTTNWSAASFGGSRGSGFRDKELSLHESALMARERVRQALHDVGPELSGVLIDVCCYLKKISEAERSAGLPQRSGKVVLGLALSALARHYGLVGASAQATRRRAAATRHWGSEGFRPSLDGSDGSTA